MSLLIGLAFAVCYAVAGLPLGWATDRYPRRLLMALCVLVWSMGTALCGLTPSLAGMFLARCVVGAGEAGLTPGSQSILGDLFPPKQLGLPMAVYAMGSRLGGAISLLVGGALTLLIPVAQVFKIPGFGVVLHGWQIIFLIISVPGVALAFLTFTMPDPPRRRGQHAIGSENDTSYGAYWKFFRENARLIAFSHLGGFAFLAAVLAVTSWAPAHFERSFNWSASRAGGVLGVVFVAVAVIGGPLNGLIVDRLYKRGSSDIHLRYLVFAAMAGLPLGVAAFVTRESVACATLLGLFMLAISSYASLPMVMLQAIVPGNIRGKAASINLLVTALLGTTVGPLIVGLFTDFLFRDSSKVGLSIALAIAILLPLSALLNGMAMRPLRRFTQKNAPLQEAAELRRSEIHGKPITRALSEQIIR